MTDDAEIALDAAALRAWPLPQPDQDDDKDARGRVLVVAGSREIPGAALLAGTAALRAGAGKLLIAAGRSYAQGLAFALPEARVMAVDETDTGGLDPRSAGTLGECAGHVDAVLIGPGMQDPTATVELVRSLLPRFAEHPVVLDALAMDAVASSVALPPGTVLTPHDGEMAHLCGNSREQIARDRARAAREAAQRWNAVVALKGPTTCIAEPKGRSWRHDGGDVGLATSGSGDTLAGIIVAIAARGAPPEQAAGWGVVVHALAGERLAQRLGRIGYLAREIPGEIPGVMERLADGSQ